MTIKKADVVLSSKTVFTGCKNIPEPALIAIRDNRIIAVGEEHDLKQYIGQDTVIHDFGDKLIMPGFHDNHLHIMMGALAMDSVNLFDARSEEEAVDMVHDYAKARPDDPWIIGFQWDSSYWDDKRFPSRSSIDRIIPDRPVLLFHAEGHYTWANSKALEVAGITRDTEDPPFGSIEKGVNGEPTGILIEGASGLATNKAFDLPKAKKEKLMQRFLKEAARFGVTSVNDLFGTNTNKKLQDFELFREFEEKEQLTVRIHLYPPLDGDLKKAKQLREQYDSEKLRVSGLKQFIDGVITSYTAYMLEPYADHPEKQGEPTFSPDTIKKWAAEADKEGFSIRFHAIGDGAIHLALDAFETAQKNNGPRDSRHSIEHVEVIHPDDISRFKELGVVASMQPDHFALSERGVYTSKIGDQREKYVFVINTLKKSGAKLAFGTDFPIDILNPMQQIYRAVTRIDSSGSDVWHPEERITLSEALHAYTHGSAFATFRENELGTLEAGKLADITVLDRNLFKVPEEDILDVKPVFTMVDGQVVFSEELVSK
ncbi:hypothetical protein EV207_103118 [Scopulibacillus darangshiensis]|uniref:Amidohydrolase 3 domain-containing protein n=1 Tax=Scopulibacillus darangshiensis TaxID=442528 RepID=A0A4R2PBF6_9BACL|nr:amidohydrolase [Scopulibacillus darangshiensis]TCP31235.1 hypothetical protein EV207_103118 [Scopulibacillus darangshiensis]